MLTLKTAVNKKGKKRRFRNGTLLLLLPDMNYMRDPFLSPQYKIRLTRGYLTVNIVMKSAYIFRLSWLFIFFLKTNTNGQNIAIF